MAFSVPTFNITCNIYTGTWDVKVLRIPDQVCNLQYGRRTARFNDFPTENESSQMMSLLLPALTDIRSVQCAGPADSVECPAGSGRVYFVVNVDDVGKGFPNEFRVATLIAASDTKLGSGSQYAGVFWPIPIP
jgi:hypothetical protein